MLNEILEKKYLLLVEGQDEVNFFEALFKNINQMEFLIKDYKGKDNLDVFISAVINSTGFANVETLLIIRDADDSFETAFKSVQRILKKNSLPVPDKASTYKSDSKIRVGVYIMPSNEENGMLEDLCLGTCGNHPIMPCVESFMNCVTSKSQVKPKNISKAKCQAFLSAMPVIANSVGLGAKKGYWNFEHESMSELRAFLLEISV